MVTPASPAPRSSASPRKPITPKAAARPGNSSAPRTICHRVSTQPTPESSAGDTRNSAPAARKMESNWGLGAGGSGFEAMRESPAVTHGCTGDWWQAATTKTAAQRTRVTLVCMPHVQHEARGSGELRHAILRRRGDAKDPRDLSLEITDQCQLPDGRQSGRAVAFGGSEIAVLVVRLGGLEAHDEVSRSGDHDGIA